MKEISPRSGALIGAIITAVLFFIFHKCNADYDFYVITLGIVTVIVGFSFSVIADKNRKANKLKRRVVTSLFHLIAVIIVSIMKVKYNIDDMKYFATVGILYIITGLIY
ncbi:MAG: hypothetical protein IKK38_05965 [Spirochaetaceae bacterium]|nr:hypothetical protein [Spirochaetaceae bacterium]